MQLELTDLHIITFTFLIPTVFSMLFRLIGLGHKGQGRIALGFGVFILYLLIVPSVLIDSMGYGEYTHIAALVMLIGSMTVLIFSSDGPVKTIFLHLIQANMVAAVLVLCNMVWYLLKLNYPALLLLVLFASAFLLWLAVRFWAKPLRFMVDTIQTGWETLIGISAVTLALVMILPTYPAHSFECHPFYYIAIILGIELCFFLSVYVFYSNLHKTSGLIEAACRQKRLNDSVDAMHMELAAREEFLSNVKNSRNDLRYHNAQIMEYLEKGDIESSISYLRTYDASILEPILPQYCQNLIVNAVLHRYVRMAQAEEIFCRIEAVIPEVLPFSEQEICILFGNLLDNACEACRKAEKGVSRILSVSAKVEDAQLLLEIKNTAMKTVLFDDQGLPLPARPGGGIGIKNITEVIKKHGDMIRFQQLYGIFTVQLMIHL